MKKIMFNDRYGLTEAVLSGRKTQTRRIIPQSLLNLCDMRENPPMFEDCYGDWHKIWEVSHAYQIGEVVAVAQSYKSIAETIAKKGYDVAKWMDEHHITKNLAGWLNKMFVKADIMIFKIRITNVSVERINDISDADCIAEGVERAYIGFFVKGLKCKDWEKESHAETEDGVFKLFPSPRKAYAALIDRISGRGTWERNPWVFAYDFELVK